MKTTTDDPKPCPLCGGEAKVGEYFLVDRRTYDPDNDWNDSRRWWHVVCTRCEVVLNNGWPTTGEAVWEWNQRPVQDELVEALRALFSYEYDDPTLFGAGEAEPPPAGTRQREVFDMALAALAKVEGAAP